MHFAQPHWLVIGLLACIGLIILFRFMHTRRQAALEKFAAHQLLDRLTRNVSAGRRRYKNILLLLAVFMCFAALARPQYGFQWVDIKRKGIDLLFALDTSKSMLAEDIKPNRLRRAHLAILDFVEQLEGDRVGLMPFAGSAYLMCPLTLDYSAFADSLAAVTTDIIPRGGTNIAAVIDTAALTLNNAANHKILIILTDGENLQGDAVKAAEEAAKQGLTIYTVGVGTSEGELIPLAGKSGQGFVKDRQGNFVTSRLDETTLSALAEKSNGLYVPLGPAGEGLETIYQQKLALIPKEELAERRQKVPLERFEWPLAAALVFVVLELLVGERKKTRSLSFLINIGRIGRIGRRGKKVTEVAVILLLLSLGITPEASCSRGEEAFTRGDYLQASEFYREKLQKAPNDPQLYYNYGTATYKNNMFDDAIDAFTKALKSDDVELQKKAYYNRGNSYYQKGVEVQQADPDTTLNQWKQAIRSLESALQLDPDDADARHNHDIIKKRLEELEKQQQQQKQQNEENHQDQQDKDNNQEQDENGEKKEQQQKGDSESDTNQQQAEDDQSKAKQNAGGNENVPEKPQAAENSVGKEDQPVPVNESEEKNQPTDQANQAEPDGQRQQLGKMTREEAESLLNALKNEEGELNFVPTDRGINGNHLDKDW
ncbi:vWA domain-containing protein [Desulfocastanea catecholica]